MIARNQKKNLKSYCSEPLEQIENFKAAEADNFAGWCIHHRLEIKPDGTRVSAKELIDKNLYYGRPASELVFMKVFEHVTLHHKGENHPFFGKHHSAETRQKISESLSGEKNPLFGKHHSEETRLKMSEAKKGSIFWNDGIQSKRSVICPGPEWKRGRLKKS